MGPIHWFGWLPMGGGPPTAEELYEQLPALPAHAAHDEYLLAQSARLLPAPTYVAEQKLPVQHVQEPLADEGDEEDVE